MNEPTFRRFSFVEEFMIGSHSKALPSHTPNSKNQTNHYLAIDVKKSWDIVSRITGPN